MASAKCLRGVIKILPLENESSLTIVFCGGCAKSCVSVYSKNAEYSRYSRRWDVGLRDSIAVIGFEA